MSLFCMFGGNNSFKNKVKVINSNAALSDTEKMAAINLLVYPYNPLINYDWSTTTTSGLRYLKDVGNTPTYNANMYSGKGFYFDGALSINKNVQTHDVGSFGCVIVDGNFTPLSVMIGKTSPNRMYLGIQSGTYRVGLGNNSNMNTGIEVNNGDSVLVEFDNGSYNLTVNNILVFSGVYTGTVASYSSFYIGNLAGGYFFTGTIKDVFLVNRLLTSSEKEGYIDRSEQFFLDMEKDGNTSFLVPLCEDGSKAFDYISKTDCTITGYTSTANITNIPYGIQTFKLPLTDEGIIDLRISDFIQCDMKGYCDTGYVFDVSDFTVIIKQEFKENNSSYRLNGSYGNEANNRLLIGQSNNSSMFTRVGATLNTTSTNSLNKDNEIAVRYDYINKKAETFVNGVLTITDTNANYTKGSTPQNFILGAVNSSKLYAVSGTISKFKAYNKKLTDSEIQNEYSKGREFHLFILAGQSNMVGRADFDNGETYPAGTIQISRNGHSGRPNYSLAPAIDPLDQRDSISGDMGLANQFCIDYKEANPNVTIVLLPCADGGTGFQTGEWKVGDPLYLELISRANETISRYPYMKLKGMLWHQGEWDVGNENYATQLDASMQGFRNSITGASNMPIVLGEISDEYVLEVAERQDINDIILDTPNRLANTSVVDSVGLTNFDTYHFDSASLRVLGSRYCESFMSNFG